MEVPSIFLNRILTQVAKKNASSMHLTAGSPPMARINNALSPIEGENIVAADTINKIIASIINEAEMKKFKQNKEIALVKELAGGFRFRVNIFSQKNMSSISFHYIPAAPKSLSELKLPKTINDLIRLGSGLFVVAGSYGSGKTTTAAALVEEVNKNYQKNIITIEDPIEYLFISKKSLISQRQVGEDVVSVTQGIKHCLDEDTDVVYVGEIKNDFNLVMPLILELAAGNSLVILEINANNSLRAIEKIINAVETKTSPEAARFSLADVFLGVITQKLMPKIGGGLVLAVEVLLATNAAKSLISEGRIYQLDSIIQTSRKEGMVSMAKSIEELIDTGVVKREDAV